MNRAIGDLDTVTDKQKYLEYNASTFTIAKRIRFEPHKGDEVSAVNAQVLIRDEMQSRFVQMQSRVASLKTENDEVSRTHVGFSFSELLIVSALEVDYQHMDSLAQIDCRQGQA